MGNLYTNLFTTHCECHNADDSIICDSCRKKRENYVCECRQNPKCENCDQYFRERRAICSIDFAQCKKCQKQVESHRKLCCNCSQCYERESAMYRLCQCKTCKSKHNSQHNSQHNSSAAWE
jgi:hypothetical protein